MVYLEHSGSRFWRCEVDGTRVNITYGKCGTGGRSMTKEFDSEEEANVGRWRPPHPAGKRPKYSPVYERHRLSFDVFMVATKDIPEGTEVIRYSGMWDLP